MSYEPHLVLSRRAEPTSEIWRLTVAVIVFAVLTLALMSGYFLLVTGLQMQRMAAVASAMTPFQMTVTLGSFLCPLLALAVVLRVLHRRRLPTLIGPGRQALRDFLLVLAVMAVMTGIALAWPSPEGMEPVRNLGLSTWLAWLPLALPALLIQTGTEELIFRGYLQSQLAARFRSPVVFILAPSIWFALLHVDASAGENLWYVVGITGLFALSAADLTARTGTLGAAMALHLGNNVSSLLLLGAAGPMTGLALYVMPVDMSDAAIRPFFAIEALLIGVSWLACRLVLRR